MRFRIIQRLTIIILVTCISVYALFAKNSINSTTFVPIIPKAWDDHDMASLQVPLANASMSPKQISAAYYYSIPVRPIYKSFPVYAPGNEPAGYIDSLKQQNPEVIFDSTKFTTEQDWINAGEIVFNAPVAYDTVVSFENIKDPLWHKKLNVEPAKDGTLPWFRYVIREKGKIEVGTLSCAMCHTRVLHDGTPIPGAQGNFPFEQATEFYARSSFTVDRIRAFERSFFGAPWLETNPLAGLEDKSMDQIIEWHTAIPPGVLARHGTHPFFPAQVSDLIGVRDRKYLDHTGLQLQGSIVDMMRYAALNQGADNLASYGDFIPAARDSRTRPDASTQRRYSDEQLYALSLYIYSLNPPKNPNKVDVIARQGQKIFDREGCVGCHTPPLYTNNKLSPVEGFSVPQEHREKYDILWTSVGTDPRLAMMTRRGTGYYKVPSLKGVWYRGPFEHNGSVATLEDWFDARRLRDDYVPTGFIGAGVKTRPVKGHLFGLDLSEKDRRALIAFLKTL
jgi:hypothetical protein